MQDHLWTSGDEPAPPSHAELLAAIGRTLGLDGSYREWPVPTGWWREPSDEDREPPGGGPAVTVLSGAVDGGRVAWVERYVHPPGLAVDGDLWVTVLVNVSGPGLVQSPRGWVHAHSDVPHRPEVSTHLADDRADRVHEVSAVRFTSDDRLIVSCAWGRLDAECHLWLPTPARPELRRTWTTREQALLPTEFPRAR
ncbi:hypothetical protein [Actinomadura xylanilytica]|uniref:hypothetical protein n=1 Tax=Actinomadura xylanilytica TaxID=887459 RepID=UPI00255B34E6|nr:hypothetical protein [Actinomadura xylanilytica]MDL4776757.1 hypothetical protein [Actinomadura xylanilytica]